MVNFNPLNHPIALKEPLRIKQSGWLYHVPFAMYLIDIIRPNTLVELGVHHGVSYSAFCQAIVDLNLPTKCYGVDTWRGDEQAGFYFDEVLEDLKAFHDPLFERFSSLMQMSFDEALQSFSDHSIDLLHIDGLHTYEAVKNDFLNWLPKVSDHGLVMFHDTNVHSPTFGVWKLWEELKEQYPSFEVDYGNGLGIIAVGSTIPEKFQALIDLSSADKEFLRAYFYRLGAYVAKENELHTTKIYFEGELKAALDAVATQVKHIDSLKQHHTSQFADLTQQYERKLELQEYYNQQNTQQAIENALAPIVNTRAWRLIQRWYNLKNQIIPPHSKRARAYALSVTSARIVKKEGVLKFTKQIYRWVVKGERGYFNKNNASSNGFQRQVTTESLTPTESESINRINSSQEQLKQLIYPYIQANQNALTILDWDSEQELHSLFPDQVIFSPPKSSCKLPYVDKSADIVITPDTPEHIKEARRIATQAIISISEMGELKEEIITNNETNEVSTFPSFSLIIPLYNHLEVTENCLLQLIKTIPQTMDVEIIVIDDKSSEKGVYEKLLKWEKRDTRIRVYQNEENMGYLMACKNGVNHSTKEIIVSLNNDTLPQPGWIEALARTFIKYPDAGAVGAKLIYLDGRLQEAGSLVTRTGGWNVGRLENPNEPQFNFLRKVDYVSGCLLATPRKVWDEIGGYDEYLRPMYFEDADYCLTAQQHGYSVYYQPQCEIIHLEGVTSGVDENDVTSPKHYQQVNRHKFFTKWHDLLQSHIMDLTHSSLEVHTMLALHGSSLIPKPQALICAPLLPEFDREGGSRRVFHIIETLQEQGWSVSLLVQNLRGGERYIELIQQMGVPVFGGQENYIHPEMILRAGQFQLVIAVFWEIANGLVEKVRQILPKAKFMVDSIDMHFLRNARKVFSTISGNLGEMEAEQYRKELNTYHKSDAVLTVSQKETDLINDFLTTEKAKYLPLMEELPISPISYEQREGILFVGNFRHPPNVQAFKFMFHEILPLIPAEILEQHPLYIVGTDLNRYLQEYLETDIPNVHMVGWVPSVFPYFDKSLISIVPLLSGAGMKSKVLQSLMKGTPLVSTSIGTEGMGLVSEEHVLVADDSQTFAQSMLRLLSDRALWEKLQINGRNHVMKEYSNATVRSQFANIIESLHI